MSNDDYIADAVFYEIGDSGGDASLGVDRAFPATCALVGKREQGIGEGLVLVVGHEPGCGAVNLVCVGSDMNTKTGSAADQCGGLEGFGFVAATQIGHVVPPGLFGEADSAVAPGVAQAPMRDRYRRVHPNVGMRDVTKQGHHSIVGDRSGAVQPPSRPGQT
jgi:hypothetical protein